MDKTLVVTNIDPLTDELIFCNDTACWNVSRALRDCAAEKHDLYVLDVAEAYAANAAVEVDEAKVQRFMRTPDVFSQPLVLVIEDGAAWMIDGHHRLRAMHRLGLTDFAAYVIEEAEAAPYQVWYNGKRKPPFPID
jgi:nucleotide-binding universal stress UspA family protein